MLFEELKYLWLLTAALIPLIIHLINRGKRNVVNVGSLNWLSKKQLKQTSKLKFQQFTLWFIRTVIFILISFIVAKPFLLKNKEVNNKHLLLVKNDVPKALLTDVMDSLNLNKWNAKWLNWNLEDVDLVLENVSSVKSIHPYKAFDLISYKNINPLSVTVLGSYNQHQLKFKIPQISFPVNWLLLPSENKNMVSEVGQINRNGKTEILEIDQNKYLTKLTTSEFLGNHLNLPSLDFNMDTVVVAYHKKYKPAAKVLNAALKAIAEYQNMSTTILMQAIEELKSDLEADILFWLSDSEMNDLKTANFKNIYFHKETLNKNTYVNVGSNINHFNYDVNINKIPALLNEMLFENKSINKKYNELVDQLVNSTFFENFKNESVINNSTQTTNKLNLNNYIVLFVLSLIIIERLICWLSN